MGLEAICEAARKNNMQFTALLQHVTTQLLAQSFFAQRRDAAVGVDSMSWREYEEGLLQRVTDPHGRLHSGAYRATSSRRVYIPKVDQLLPELATFQTRSPLVAAVPAALPWVQPIT